MENFTIGHLAKKANVNIETIRFYERNGLLPKPQRSPAGYRLYTQREVNRLHFISIAKRHGFTLREIHDLLDLRVHSTSTCEQVRRKSEAKIMVIDEKIKELKRIKRALSSLVATCQGDGPASECPILDAFENAD